MPLRTIIIPLLCKRLQSLPILRLAISAPAFSTFMPHVINGNITLISFLAQPHEDAPRILVNGAHKANLLIALLNIILVDADSVDPEDKILRLVSELVQEIP